MKATNETQTQVITQTYLGDGVYASYNPDTEMMTLTTGSHIIEQADAVIFLEIEVIRELAKLLKSIGAS